VGAGGDRRNVFEALREDWERHGRQLRNRALWALAVYRFGRWSMGLHLAPGRWLTGKIYGLLNVLSEITTGVTMDRNVRIGRRFHIIHAATIFIHPDVVIGDRCGITHNVTIGTNMDGRVPVIGDDVFIGCGASVLGGIRIGDNVRIAANSLVINDVPANSFVAGVPAKAYPRLTAGRRPSAPAPEAVARQGD
jgi:serine O-acetyltransferase